MDTADWLEEGANDLEKDGLPYIAAVHRILAAAVRALGDVDRKLHGYHACEHPSNCEEVSESAHEVIAQAEALRAAHERGEGT
jgi:hypothetical protein